MKNVIELKEKVLDKINEELDLKPMNYQALSALNNLLIVILDEEKRINN